MFDGYALLVKLRMDSGRVFASHRFLQTQAYQYFRYRVRIAATRYMTLLYFDLALQIAGCCQYSWH